MQSACFVKTRRQHKCTFACISREALFTLKTIFVEDKFYFTRIKNCWQVLTDLLYTKHEHLVFLCFFQYNYIQNTYSVYTYIC